MNSTLRRCLDDLASRIDPAVEEANIAQWARFWREGIEPFFRPTPRPANPPRVTWPDININDAIGDMDLMLLSQLKVVSDTLDGGGTRLAVRCNYGTGILPSLLGCELFMMPRETNTLPAARPLGSAQAVRRLLDNGMPDLHASLGGEVFRCGERFLEIFRRWPAIGRHVDLYHPDAQGPIDVLEVVWGSDIFYAFCDEVELIRDALDLVTRMYAAFMREWFALVPPAGEFSTHWGMQQRGTLMIRNDSLMNLSPQVYVDLIRPMDQRLLDEFGGGAIHACGRAEHYVEAMSQMRGLHAVNFSQPHLNNMETIYRNTVDKGIRLVGLDRKAVDAALAAGRPLRGLVHSH
jgi:hypothetical protein